LLQGRCAAESVLGFTPDISSYIQHGWYDVVWYRDADGEDKLGHWLGPATQHGGGDAYWLLPLSCKPIIRSTVWSLTVSERAMHSTISSIDQLNRSIESKIGDSATLDDNMELFFPNPCDSIFADDEIEDELHADDRRSEADQFTPEIFDNYINAQVLL
jgi:hypothetical protein